MSSAVLTWPWVRGGQRDLQPGDNRTKCPQSNTPSLSDVLDARLQTREVESELLTCLLMSSAGNLVQRSTGGTKVSKSIIIWRKVSRGASEGTGGALRCERQRPKLRIYGRHRRQPLPAAKPTRRMERWGTEGLTRSRQQGFRRRWEAGREGMQETADPGRRAGRRVSDSQDASRRVGRAHHERQRGRCLGR